MTTKIWSIDDYTYIEVRKPGKDFERIYRQKSGHPEFEEMTTLMPPITRLDGEDFKKYKSYFDNLLDNIIDPEIEWEILSIDRPISTNSFVARIGIGRDYRNGGHFERKPLFIVNMEVGYQELQVFGSQRVLLKKEQKEPNEN